MMTKRWKRIAEKLKAGYLLEMGREAAWMYGYARRYWKAMIFYIGAGIAGTLMGLGSSVASKFLIDAVTGHQMSSVGGAAGALIVLAVGNIGTRAVVSRISAKITVQSRNKMQADIYNSILYTDWESLQEFRSGDLLSRLEGDVRQVADSVIGWIPGVITRLFQFLGTLAVILYYDPTMAALAVLSAPVTLAASRILMKRMRDYSLQMRDVNDDLMSFQNDSLRNLQTVKAFGLMDVFSSRMTVLQDGYQEKMLNFNRFTIYTSSFLSMVGMAVSYICFGWGVYRLWGGYITIGTMMMFLQMAGALSTALSALIQTVPQAINATTCAGRLMSVAGLKREQTIREQAVKNLEKKSAGGLSVVLKEVQIGYRGAPPVISGGDFQADRGEIVAVIGSSGEGKTTLLRLLLGLIYPAKGEAFLASEDGEQCPLSAGTRHFFSYVPQGNTMFGGTIAENLRLVKPEAGQEELEEALRTGCAWEFVKELPEGIHSPMGEQGGGFSEGQAQRIAIARAVLRDAPVLLLDEATSALDMETEKQVLENLMGDRKQRTCIVTTHRPSVLSMCHHIYEIQGNRLEKIR